MYSMHDIVSQRMKVQSEKLYDMAYAMQPGWAVVGMTWHDVA